MGGEEISTLKGNEENIKAENDRFDYINPLQAPNCKKKPEITTNKNVYDKTETNIGKCVLAVQ